MLRRAIALSASCTGLYYSNYFKHHYARCEPTDPKQDYFPTDTLFPSFKAVLLKKIYHMDFSELRKQEVLIELGLISIPLILTGIASSRLIFHSKRSWHRKDFYNIMNVSLNTIIRTPKPISSTNISTAYQTYKYTLYFRTLMEKELRDVIPNEEGIKQLIEAAKKTDDSNPFIIIKNSNNHWTVCNQIANQISSICAHSFIHRDIVYHNFINNKCGEIDDSNMSQSCSSGNFLSNIKSKNGVNIASNIETGVYLMALTCEPERSVRNRKIRVMLIQENMIQQLLEDMKREREDMIANINNDNKEENIIEVSGNKWTAKLEDPVHSARWELIKKIVYMYDKQEKRNNGKIKWGKPLCDMELCTTSLSDNVVNLQRDLIEQHDVGTEMQCKKC